MLYSNHLETFITVVESGSFRGAAEKIGISPSAVLKQISLLEQDLKVAVFDRSRRGVTLTEAGESIYRDSKYILKYCNGAAERARELYTKQNRIIRIGVSVMNPPNHLVKIWENVYRINPEVKCRFVSFESTAAGMERAFSTIGQDCDVIAGVYDDAFLKKYDLKALHLFDISVVIGYAPGSFPQERIHHPGVAGIGFSDKDFVEVMFAAGVRMKGGQHLFIAIEEARGGGMVDDGILRDDKVRQLLPLLTIQRFEQPLQHSIWQGLPCGMLGFYFADSPLKRPGRPAKDEFLRKGMGRLAVCNVIPAVFFRMRTELTLRRIVPYIQDICPGFLGSGFRDAAIRGVEQRPLEMGILPVHPHKTARIGRDECREFLPGSGIQGGMDMVRHLTQGQDPDVVFLRFGAEYGEKHQIVTDAVKDQETVPGSLVQMVQYALMALSDKALRHLPSFSGRQIGRCTKIGIIREDSKSFSRHARQAPKTASNGNNWATAHYLIIPVEN